MTTIQGNSQVQLDKPFGAKNTVVKDSDSTATKSPIFKSDSINIGVKKGAGVSFKGAMAGGLGSAAAVSAGLLVATKGKAFSGEGAIVSAPLAFGAFLGGAIGGGVAANTTTSKSKGAAVGALGGALVGGALIGLSSKSIGGAVSGAVVGGITGASGGFFGSLVAKNK